MSDPRPLSHRHSLAGLPLSRPPTSPYPALSRTQTHHYVPPPPAAVPPFQHHNSEGTNPYTASPLPSGDGGAGAGLYPPRVGANLSRDWTVRAQDPLARGLRAGGRPQASPSPSPTASPPVRPPLPPHGSSSSSNETVDGRGGLKKLLKSKRPPAASPTAAHSSPYPLMRPSSAASAPAAPSNAPTSSLYASTRWQSGAALYPPLSPASNGPYPPHSPASSGPYPPFVSSPTSSTAPQPGSYSGSLPASPSGASHAARPPAMERGSGWTPAELEQEAVERACEQGIAAEQRRISALALEEERLLRLTLEESSSSAALEQLRANALARERAQAEERALREALLSSRNEAAGRVRAERRRMVEEEKAVQHAMVASRRESEGGTGKGKGKGKAREEDEVEDEIERREREALELAMQLSLQEEEKRRLARGGFTAADADVEEVEPGTTSSTSPAAALPATSSFAGTSSAAATVFSSTSSLDDLPPAYEPPQHARELDEPTDVIIGPGRPLPLAPAPPPPSGAALAQLQRLVVEKHAGGSGAGAYLPAQAAYPSFAPYAHAQGSGSESLAASSSVGSLSVAATAGSFDEGGVTGRNSYASIIAAEPEVLDVAELGADDPFDDRFAEEEAASQGAVDVGEPAQSQRHDLFAEVLARRATQRTVRPSALHEAFSSAMAYPSRPVLDIANDESVEGSHRLEEQEPTPVATLPPALPSPVQPSSEPASQELATDVAPPAAARHPPASTPASPSTLASFRSDPSAGGFVEDVGALVPFADEHVLRDVRWGFVDDETSAAGRFPRLEHEGDFPRGAQLSAVRGVDGKQPYRAFAVEARTWQGLLVYLMWHGNSRFEAAPHDLQADKSGRGLQAHISVDFYRSGRSSSSAVSVRPPRVRVRLKLLPPDPNTPARRQSSAFTIVAPPALEPVNPSIRLTLATEPFLPLALSDLATLLSQAHSASRSVARHARRTALCPGGALAPAADGRAVLAHAVDLFRRLNGEEVRPAEEEDEAGGPEEEVGLLDRLKARLRRRRGPRVIEGQGGASVAGGGALPEGATFITPFAL